MDFYDIRVYNRNSRNSRNVTIEPRFIYGNSKDLAVKGGKFFAFWDGEVWNPDFERLANIIDQSVKARYEESKQAMPENTYEMLLMEYFDSGIRAKLIDYCKLYQNSDITFNEKILFLDDPIRREDFATTRLSYNPQSGATDNFDELFGVLYDEDELKKIMWFVGALLSGDMNKIEKFLFLYGGKGTGKGTIIKVIKMMLENYYDSISLKNLTGASDFSTSEVQEIPCLIDEDCDISTITNDTNLLKLTSHEPIIVNQKYQSPYQNTFKGLLIAASNERFKVKHVDSGITRRAVVAEPTRKLVGRHDYDRLMNGIKFEISAIAQKCIDVYLEMGHSYYDNYVDINTIEETDHVYAFVDTYREQLGDPVTLTSAAAMYKEYLEDIGFGTDGYKRKIKKALTRYYEKFLKRTRIDGIEYRNVYRGFKDYLFKSEEGYEYEDTEGWIKWDGNNSILDINYLDQPAQYANQFGTPNIPWDDCTTKLKDLETDKLHFVITEPNHIVIDFDLKGPDGEKSLELNVREANRFPKTYAEVSKSGQGVHLHYIYDGDVSRLSSLYEYNIEIKTFPGKSSLRRMLTHCNKEQIAVINTGLPLKEESNVYESVQDMVWTERKVRTAIEKNLLREYHPNTKPSIDFIKKILDDAVAADLKFDVSDMKLDVILFAMDSSNQKDRALQVVNQMVFSTIPEEAPPVEYTKVVPNEDLWFYDVEVYSNVFIIVAKKFGVDEYKTYINPTPYKVEEFMKLPLVGFNNLRYDNHILMGALMGENNQQLYERSQKIINNDRGGYHRAAYDVSYLDVYEMSTKKQSLKKFEADLGIKHDEMDHPWDKPLPEELWDRAVDYCKNDVDATEAVFIDRADDYQGRLILAEISGLPVNSKTQDHTAEIIFEGDPNPQDKFVYTDLSEEFPGYEFNYGKSMYRGIDPSEGGYVYSEPGVYQNVGLFDVESEHPTSLVQLNYFGPYTKNFKAILDARLDIKHGDYDTARQRFNGKLAKYLNDVAQAKGLSYALKIAINIVYGMTSASFPNKFKHPDNKDNIVAKRGALFMIDLQLALQDMGVQVVHIKTDSVKVVDPTPEIEQFIHDFGAKYGYKFEYEAKYSRMALVNKAVYIAQYDFPHKGEWTATGAMFAEPYVFKKLFSHEILEDSDFFIKKSTTKDPIYLDEEFVGKVATVYASNSGYEMYRRVERDGEVKKSAITGTKGFKWRLASEFRGRKDIDMDYYNKLAKDAMMSINKIGNVHLIIDDIPDEYINDDLLPF